MIVDENIELVSDGYEIKEVNQIQTDENDDECFAVADRDDRIVWLWDQTPLADRPAAIFDAMQAAACVAWTPAAVALANP